MMCREQEIIERQNELKRMKKTVKAGDSGFGQRYRSST